MSKTHKPPAFLIAAVVKTVASGTTSRGQVVGAVARLTGRHHAAVAEAFKEAERRGLILREYGQRRNQSSRYIPTDDALLFIRAEERAARGYQP